MHIMADYVLLSTSVHHRIQTDTVLLIAAHVIG